MLLSVVLFMLWLTTNSLSTPLYKSRHYPKYTTHVSHKFPTRRSQSLLKLDRQAALAARAATQRKFQNAPSLLAGLGVSPGYTIPSSLQETYDRASDYATNITLLSSLFNSIPYPSSYSPSVIRVAAGSLSNATVDPLQDDTDGVDDFEYYGSMCFGSHAQSLLIDFDTGSADLWVPVNCSDCGSLSPFQANASSTYLDTNQPFSVTYGSGSVKGTLARDTVSLGQLKVDNQSFGAVQSVSEEFANAPNDGLVGMAFSTIANSHQPTFFENLMPWLQAPLFSVYMTRKQVRGSEIYLGGIDASRASEDTIRWVPVVSMTYWTVSMTGALVNGTHIQTEIANAIIDTGTSFIYLPTPVAAAIYKWIPGASPAPDYSPGFYAYPCATQVAVSFVLGAQTLALDPRDFNLGRHDGDPSGKTCIAALVDAGDEFEFAILGDSFLKSFMSIYDYSHGARVGFVKSINE